MPDSTNAPDRASVSATSAADGDAIDWLIRLQDEPDDRDARQGFEHWHRQPQHAHAWARLQRTDDLLRAVEARRRTRRRTIGGGAMGAAALCTALILVPDAALRWRADAATGTGETRAVTLADGSTIRLAPRSAIALDDRGAERRVRLLRGTAWFDVVHDPRRPFRVATGGITTTVLGTAFEVRRASGTGAAISVRRGAVRVACDQRPGAPHRLPAGRSLDLACGDHAALASVAPDRIAPWIDGRFIADDTSVRSVIDALRPWYRGTIVARGEHLDRVHVTGVYDMRDPAAALAALAATGRVQMRQITPWITIIYAN